MTTYTTPIQRANAELVNAAVNPALLGKLLLAPAQLHQHQIDVLTRLGPLLYTDSPIKNTAFMGPSGIGITTILAIMAIHHALFSPMKTAVFLMRDTKAVNAFNSLVESMYATLQKSHFITMPLENQPGKISAKTTTLTNLKAHRGSDVIAVYMDTPSGIGDSETLKRMSIAAESSTSFTRVHVLTSGFNAPIAQAIKSGSVRGVAFAGMQVDIKDLKTAEEIEELFNLHGEQKFVSDFLCMDPTDPNSLANFYHL